MRYLKLIFQKQLTGNNMSVEFPNFIRNKFDSTKTIEVTQETCNVLKEVISNYIKGIEKKSISQNKELFMQYHLLKEFLKSLDKGKIDKGHPREMFTYGFDPSDKEGN